MTPIDAKRPLQLNDQGQLRHFLSLDGLPRELLTEILDTADSFLEVGARAVTGNGAVGLGASSAVTACRATDHSARAHGLLLAMRPWLQALS